MAGDEKLAMSLDTDIILSVGSLALTLLIAFGLRLTFHRGRDIDD